MNQDNVYYVFGESKDISFTKFLYNYIFNKALTIITEPIDQFYKLMDSKNFSGLILNYPYGYSKDLTSYCDTFSQSVLKTGFADVIIKNVDNSLYGDNSEYEGFFYLIKHNNINVKGKNIVILGENYQSKAILAVLKKLKANKVYTVSQNGGINFKNVYGLKYVDIIINTSKIGHFPDNYSLNIDVTRFKNIELVIDTTVNPIKTKLLLNAEHYGIKAINGVSMLIGKYKYIYYLFTGKRFSQKYVTMLENALLHKFYNIVLIGMPGSGKTTLAKILSRKMKRTYIDIDKYIVSKEGKTVPEIFETNGEEYFREQEKIAVKEIAKTSGIIIATGGGTVKNYENIETLKQNGLIFYIDRDISELSTKGRPLSSDYNKVKQLYDERHDLYSSYCDIVIKNKNIGITVVARNIMEAYNEYFSN